MQSSAPPQIKQQSRSTALDRNPSTKPPPTVTPPPQDGTLTAEELLRSLALDGAVDDEAIDAGVFKVGGEDGGWGGIGLDLEGRD